MLVQQQLAETKHAKLLLKTDQPVCHTVLSDVTKFVTQCLAMLSNNEVTEGLLIAVLGANFVLLFYRLACCDSPPLFLTSPSTRNSDN